MAKQRHTDPVNERNGRIIRTEAYAEKVRQLFAATVNDILAINKTMPDIANGVMYSFDGDTRKVRQNVETLMRRLHSVTTMAIQKGIVLEWDAADKACDSMVRSCFGKELMSDPKFKAWTAHNTTARDAFIRRTENGLNLSARVWRDVQALRDEMEVAITVAMGEGESAANISRQVRQYLNDPDLMFRRFQYHEKEPMLDADGHPVVDRYGNPQLRDKLDKNGNPIVRKKWKKRIADPDNPARYKWIDYDRDSYTPQGAGRNSRGVYKSAAKNAMRVARTETNMAYRAADHERWKRMDFVLGVHVETSNNHPLPDICDTLKGDYPKDFHFCGWHPQCFCHATAILPSEEEMLALVESYEQGKPYSLNGVIEDYPDEFKDWVKANEAKIHASHDKGTDPYFVRENFAAVQGILNPKKQLTPHERQSGQGAAPAPPDRPPVWERSKARHDARTPEQTAEVQRRWANSREYHRLSNDPNFTDVHFDYDTGGLKATHISHVESPEIHTKESKYFSNGEFEGYTGKDLEVLCQDRLYQKGYSCILQNEKYKINGEVAPALDTITNGHHIDIRSITQNNPNTVYNALLAKHSQIERCRAKGTPTSDALILYFHEDGYFTHEKVTKALADYSKSRSTIKRLICVLGSGKVIEIK